MGRPLYIQEPSSLPRGGNAGLWYDKFCDKWNVKENNHWSLKSDKDKGAVNPKQLWIQTLTGFPVGNKELIHEVCLRVAGMTLQLGGCLEVFQTESRFVTGLGRSHPVENGFAFHHTLGVPFIRGSSIKGMIRAWAREEADEERIEEIQRIFGDQDENGAGSVDFLDVLPLEPARLEADVMTPHYAGWTSEEPPGDWNSPTPIPFLVTAKGAKFLFSIIPREDSPEGKALVERVLGWLREALRWNGAGAKTAVGYGRMRPLPEETEKVKKEVEQWLQDAQLPPFEKWAARNQDILSQGPSKTIDWLLELGREHPKDWKVGLEEWKSSVLEHLKKALALMKSVLHVGERLDQETRLEDAKKKLKALEEDRPPKKQEKKRKKWKKEKEKLEKLIEELEKGVKSAEDAREKMEAKKERIKAFLDWLES